MGVNDLQVQNIQISSEFITLGQLLKFAGVIGSGGEAKDYLEEVTLKVNGELEGRRGRKLYAGDLIELPGNLTLKITDK